MSNGGAADHTTMTTTMSGGGGGYRASASPRNPSWFSSPGPQDLSSSSSGNSMFAGYNSSLMATGMGSGTSLNNPHHNLSNPWWLQTITGNYCS